MELVSNRLEWAGISEWSWRQKGWNIWIELEWYFLIELVSNELEYLE
jgi:hypothetical protein